MSADLIKAALVAIVLHALALLAVEQARVPAQLALAEDGTMDVVLATAPAPAARSEPAIEAPREPAPTEPPREEPRAADARDSRPVVTAATTSAAPAPEPVASVREPAHERPPDAGEPQDPAAPILAQRAPAPVPQPVVGPAPTSIEPPSLPLLASPRGSWRWLPLASVSPSAEPEDAAPAEPRPAAPPRTAHAIASQPRAVPPAMPPAAPPGPVSDPVSAGAPPAGPTSSPPVALRNEPPAYPRVARQRGQEGIVELRVQVRADGTCGEVVVDKGSGHRVLDRAAVKAVRRWRFRPATRDGRPVDDWIAVPVEFDLEY